MTGDDMYGFHEMDWGKTVTKFDHLFGLDVDLPENISLILCLDNNISQKISILNKRMLHKYNKLVSESPFPAWKKGLYDVWE